MENKIVVIAGENETKLAYILAKSIESIETQELDNNKLGCLIVVTTKSGKEYTSRIYDSHVDANNKLTELIEFVFGKQINDKDIYELN